MRVDLTDPDMPDWRKYLFTCDADDHHWLLFEWWDNDPDDLFAGNLDVVPTTYAPRLRQRIVTAVKVLFGRQAWTTDCVLLNEPTAVRLRETIDLYLANERAKRAKRHGSDGDTDFGGPGRPNRILWNRRPGYDVHAGEIDEIVLHYPSMVHVEQMDDSCWYIGIDMPDGTSWTGNFTGRGYMTFSEQENDGIVWDADDTHENKAADSE